MKNGIPEIKYIDALEYMLEGLQEKNAKRLFQVRLYEKLEKRKHTKWNIGTKKKGKNFLPKNLAGQKTVKKKIILNR